jgi:release factor glutamine methyltransferase
MHAAGVDSPRLTAIVLLEHVSDRARTSVLAHPEAPASPREARAYWQLIERRCAREPLAYILGYREFYGRRFAVNPHTLIPRPETEETVGLALDQLRRMAARKESPLNQPDLATPAVLDVGVGSGAIAITLLLEQTHLRAVGTDVNFEALRIARANARYHDVSERLRLVASDLADGVSPRFPLIVANLPYIPTDEIPRLEPEVAHWEPATALDGGTDGTLIIRRLLGQLPQWLAEGGCAMLEVGDLQAEDLMKYASLRLPGWSVASRPDAAGIERFLILSRPER